MIFLQGQLSYFKKSYQYQFSFQGFSKNVAERFCCGFHCLFNMNQFLWLLYNGQMKKLINTEKAGILLAWYYQLYLSENSLALTQLPPYALLISFKPEMTFPGFQIVRPWQIKIQSTDMHFGYLILDVLVVIDSQENRPRKLTLIRINMNT